MPEAGITVQGLAEVQKNLSAFPRLLVVGCFNKAFKRAAAVFEEEIRANTPETEYSTSSEEYGHLVDNLMDEISLDTQGRGGRLKIGFGKAGFVALFVEYGHRMVTHSKKDTGKFVPANPFMRKAFAAAAGKALEAFTEAIQEYMKTASIKAGG